MKTSQPSRVHTAERSCSFKLGPITFDCGVSKSTANEISIGNDNLPGDVCSKSKTTRCSEAKDAKSVYQSSIQPLRRSLSLHDSDSRTRVMAKRENSNPSPSGGHPTVVAWTEGRIVKACRELRKIEDAGARLCLLDNLTTERIHRIAARYEQSLGERTIGGDWVLDQDAADNIRVAYRTGSTLYQTSTAIDFDGEDALMAFVALCETDLSMAYDMNCESIQQLGEQNHPFDSVWRVQRTGQFGREDNIRQLSCLDALDEPQSALWVSMYPPHVGEAKVLRGMKLPLPLAGRTRNVHSKTNFFIEPVKNTEGGFLPGFRLVYTTCTRPSAVVKNFLSVTPRRLMIRQLRDKAAQLHKCLRDHMGNCAEMACRFSSGPRAACYNSVAKRLSSRVLLPSPQLELAPLPATNKEATSFQLQAIAEEGKAGLGCEGHHTAVDSETSRSKEANNADLIASFSCAGNDFITASSTTSISDVKTIADLSMHVGSNWAD